MTDVRNKVLLLIALLALSAFYHGAAAFAQATGSSAPDVIVEKDIIYGTGGAEKLRLDLARPATGEGPFPVVVFFAGNSWGWLPTGYPPELMWTFRMYDSAIQYCARKGYVAVTVETRGVNIRLGGKILYRFPAAVEDAKCAIRWLNANAGSYHIRTDRIVSIGWSSGGTLSLFLALTRPEDGFEGSGGNPGISSQVAGAVSIEGVTDMAACFLQDPPNQKDIQAWVGGTPEANAPGYKAASPITWVRAGAPPVFIVAGEIDKEVPVSQATALDARLTELGVPHGFHVIPQFPHENGWDIPQIWNFVDSILLVP